MEIKLKVESLTDQAYDVLKSKIISKEFPPGMRLVDSQIAKEYGISRTPLRDAIRKLYEEGLVTSNGGRGYCVFQPTRKDIEEIFEIRLIIDRAVVTKLIKEILPGNAEAVESIRRVYKELEGQKGFSGEHFVKSDEDFHDLLISMMGNSRLSNYYDEIRSQTRAFRQRTSGNSARIAKLFDCHERICRSLLALDLEEALTAVTDHIAISIEYTLTDFQS